MTSKNIGYLPCLIVNEHIQVHEFVATFVDEPRIAGFVLTAPPVIGQPEVKQLELYGRKEVCSGACYVRVSPKRDFLVRQSVISQFAF